MSEPRARECVHCLLLFAFAVSATRVLVGSDASKSVGKPDANPSGGAAEAPRSPLSLDWKDDILEISAPWLPGGTMRTLWLEAYCRPGSTDADWVTHTVIGHDTSLIERSADGRVLRLRCELSDGVRVDHVLRSTADEVDFRLTAHNPTATRSDAHWAQPCIRVGEFTGLGDPARPASYEYIRKCFIFVDREQRFLPTTPWATEARYTPGQVWAAPGVSRADVNPRPLSVLTPSNGLIGCTSADETMIFATACEPYQELFQGVITCIHSDFRIGGLEPGETKEIRGKFYFLPNDPAALVERYERDFPDQARWANAARIASRARVAHGGIHPRIDPAGRRVALSYQGAIAVVPADGGVLMRIADGVPVSPGAVQLEPSVSSLDIEPCWSPDGRSLAWIRSRDFVEGPVAIARVGDALEVASVEIVSPALARGRISFHPDGRRVLGNFRREGGPSRPALIDIATGELENLPLPELDLAARGLVFALSPDGASLIWAHSADVPGEQDGNRGPWATLRMLDIEQRRVREFGRFPARIYELDWPRSDTLLAVSDLGASHQDIWSIDPRGGLRSADRLSSGQADECRPSMAATGDLITYSDNAGSATSIARLDRVTGASRSLAVERVESRLPLGRMRLRIFERESGRPVVAAVSLDSKDGKPHAAMGALYRRTAGRTYSYARYATDIDAPAGDYRLRVTRGPEIRAHEATISIEAGVSTEHAVFLDRWADSRARGEYSGENHIHANYGYGAWYSTPESVLDQVEGEDLRVAHLVVANSDGDGVFDREYFLGDPDPISNDRALLRWGEEFRSTIWGHLTLAGIATIVEPVFTGFAGTTNPLDVPTNADVAALARERGGVVSYTHPASNASSPYGSVYGAKGLPLDAALGAVDTIDVLGFGYGATLDLWYRLLDCGFRLPAASGTDCFLNRIVSYPPGWGRTYVQLGAFGEGAWLEGQKTGRSFVSTGPMLRFDVDGIRSGGEIFRALPTTLHVRATVEAQFPLDVVEVVLNARVVHRRALEPAEPLRTRVEFAIDVDAEASGWIALRASGSAPGEYPAPGQRAHANPVWLTIAERPNPNRTVAAKYFLDWLDRLELDVSARGRLGARAAHVAGQFAAAREVYRRSIVEK
jgi:hypothetical protein